MNEFDELVGILKRLRAKDGCPWDREQTHESILQCAVDEVYEFLEAAESKDDAGMKEELGDLLLQVVFHSQMASERGAFTISDVVESISRKLYTRHPHVFGSVQADTSRQVLRNWEEIKQKEKPHRTSVLDGVPHSLPALFKAEKIQRKAARVGFDWAEPEPVLNKVREEFEELAEALRAGRKEEAGEELGDILFALVNVARHFEISAEEALRKTIEKFSRRFRHVEDRLRETGKEWKSTSLAEMDTYWDEAKQRERKSPGKVE